jgi:hypothetical protein
MYSDNLTNANYVVKLRVKCTNGEVFLIRNTSSHQRDCG